MSNKKYDKIFDNFIEEAYKNEYMPSAIEPYELFLKKKKAELTENFDERMLGVFDGIMLISMLETENEKIQNLIGKFFTFDKLAKELENEKPEAISKKLIETNFFDLTDEDFDYLMQMGNDVLQTGRVAEAITIFQALTFLCPTRIESWLSWANTVYENQFDYQSVLTIYNECRKHFNHPVVYFCIGICHVKGNEYPKAIESLHRCIALCDQYDEIDLKANAEELLKKLPVSTY